MSGITVLILFLLVPLGYAAPSKVFTTLANRVKETLHSIPETVSRAGDLFYLATVDKPNNTVGRGTGVSNRTASAKSSILWTKKELKSISEKELDKEIGSICNSTPIDSVFTGLTEIAIGSFAKVYKGMKSTTNDVAAIKVIEIEKGDVVGDKRSVLVEVTVSKKSVHENIVHFIEAYSNRAGQKLTVYLVMEYMTGGTLESILGEYNYAHEDLHMTEPQIATVCVQILKGLKCLHDKGVVHRDIKSRNIMLSVEGLVKLCDFGLAANSRGKHCERTGTPQWMAPEVIQRREYNEKVDIWSFGIVVFEMFVGTTPFRGHQNEVYDKILNLTPDITPFSVSPLLYDFVNRCLNKQQSERPSAENLLNHPFLSNSDPPDTLSPLIKARLANGTEDGSPPVTTVQTGVTEVNVV